MKNTLLYSLLLLIFYTYGCKRSTLDPNDVPFSVTHRLLSNTWDIQSLTNSSGNPIDSSSGYILKLNSDGTYVQSSPFSATKMGRWLINEKDSTLTLIPDNNTETEEAKLTIISSDTLGFITKSGKSVISISKSTPLFSISGKIVNPKNINIPANHKLSVVWQSNDTTVGYVWGDGKINEWTGTFVIDFPTYMPDDIIQQLVVCNERSGGIGYIYLHSDQNIISGKYTLPYCQPKRTIGIVKDRALIYLFGMPIIDNQQITPCLWNGNFQMGYNLSITPFGQETQSFMPTNKLQNNELVITNDPTVLTQKVDWGLK